MEQTKVQESQILTIISEGETIVKDSLLYLVSKRLLDIIGALIGIIIFSPVFVIVPIMYLFGDNKGPVFFKQIRLAKNGKEFYIYKFRSMVTNAENKLKQDKKLYQKYIANNYKLDQDEDPRITKLGGFLRKTSFDEIPQFFNVLKGNMSIVGPRPVVLDELKEYGNRNHIFLSVKPGITGYWQVSGRSNVGYPERADLELYYAYHRSIKLDIEIIVRTLFVVAARKGAY